MLAMQASYDDSIVNVSEREQRTVTVASVFTNSRVRIVLSRFDWSFSGESVLGSTAQGLIDARCAHTGFGGRGADAAQAPRRSETTTEKLRETRGTRTLFACTRRQSGATDVLMKQAHSTSPADGSRYSEERGLQGSAEQRVTNAHSDPKGARPPRRWDRIAAGCIVMPVTLAFMAVVAERAWLRLADFRMRRRTEGTHMVQAIRAAEEAFHAEAGTYANVSRALAANERTNHFALYPQAPREPGASRVPWGSECPPSACLVSWSVLPVHVEVPVRFGYSVVAGHAGERPLAVVTIDGAPLTWPVPTQDWYIVTAVGDVYDEGVFTTVVATSFDDTFRIDEPPAGLRGFVRWLKNADW